MLLRNLLLSFWLTFAVVPSAYAGFRVAGGVGLGSTTTSNEISEDEGPLTMLISVDYVYHSKLILGFEHLRSLAMSPPASSNSFSGLYFQWYWNAVPTPYIKADNLKTDEIVFRDIGYFWGTGVGIAQSANLPDAQGKTSNAAGFYLSPRVGADLQLTNRMGVRGEFIMATTVIGTGSVSSMSLLGSIYFSFN
ncbi:hypothetical protein B9G69_011065 [Bdellovibrio sp. SKB1291214]|uniref:hypothetical protein n=1 Tax=Bdellovibrio sp. SKB1291214 TaxID=1732569 RepID=UPI000B517D09|nr:hypothetical protein [Bdellovibrio sp. SKB1291214]UYL07585.1 hypothetical protein B9G69_011065 [Bdellovibrio sp. SKB1291214]